MPACASSYCRPLLVILGLAVLVLSSFALADPLPTPLHWMGGRLVPAQSVPVDMVSEQLVVRLTRHQPPQRGGSYSEYYFAQAEVDVTYVLRADSRFSVPIVFPIIGEPRSVSFVINGASLPTKVISDRDLYSAYEQAWRSAIDRYVGADRVLAGLRQEARSSAKRSPQASPNTQPLRPGDIQGFMLVFSRTQRRLDELGLPDSKGLAWGLSHYFLDDWEPGLGGERLSADFAQRRRLGVERQLALAFAPKTPDPAALWSTPATTAIPNPSAEQRVFFVSARLNLRRGDNQFRVRYQHPVSFTNVRYEMAPKTAYYSPSHKQANVFEFILRTARFWRSFGDLSATVYLPSGTRHATCNLPGATVSLAGTQPTVVCAAKGVPDQNLAVSFADFKVLSDPTDDEEPFRDKPSSVPATVLRALWDYPGTGRHLFGSAPAADDQVVAVGGMGEITLLSRERGKVIQRLPVTGEAKHMLLLPDVVVAGTELKGKGSYDKPSIGLVCVDRSTGAVRWSHALPGPDYQGYDTQPTLAGSAVLASADRGPVFAVELRTGKLLWQQSGSFRGLALSADGQVAYFAGAEITAMDVMTGKVKWHCPAGYESFIPAIWGERLLVTGMDKRYAEPFLACLDSNSGKILWKKPLGKKGPLYNRVYAARVQDNRLLVCHDEGIIAYDLQHPPAVIWHASFKYQLMAAPVMTEQFVYAPGRLGGLQEFDLRTGRLTRELTCSRMDCVATLAGNQLFTLEFSGLLTAWSLDGQTAAAPAPVAGAGWPGVPPSDLPQTLVGASTTGGLFSPRNLAAGAATITLALLIVVLQRRRRARLLGL